MESDRNESNEAPMEADESLEEINDSAITAQEIDESIEGLEEPQEIMEDMEEYLEVIYEPEKPSFIPFLLLSLSMTFFLAGAFLFYRNYSMAVLQASAGSQCSNSPARAAVPLSISFTEYLFTGLPTFHMKDFRKLIDKVFVLLKEFLERSSIPTAVPATVTEIASSAWKLTPFAGALLRQIDTIQSVSVQDKELSAVIEEVVAKRIPAVLRDTEATQWKALKWNYYEIANSIPYLDQVLSLPKSESEVYLTSHAAEGSMPPATHHHSPTGINNILFDTFLSNMKNPQAMESYLFSGNYKIIESLALLYHDTAWTKFQYIEKLAASNNISVTETAPQLTLMYPETALQARHSEYHIFRVQLHGRARYTLIEPKHAKNLYPFPSHHPSALQSQVNFHNETILEQKYPRAKNIEAMQVEMARGDVLYIPPYHYIHSETLTNSKKPITTKRQDRSLGSYIDILSPSLEQLILTEASLIETQFDAVKSIDERVLVAQMFIVHIISRIPTVKTPQKFSRSLYTNRYSLLYPENSLALQKLEMEAKFLPLCTMDTAGEAYSTLFNEVIDRIGRERITKTAEVIASAVNDPAVPGPVKLLWLGNYIEKITKWAMEDQSHLSVVFIKNCLNYNKKLEIIVEVEGPSVIKIN